MTAAIALNRFGLGARPDQAPPPDPRRWLLAQFDAFEPKPQALAGVPSRTQIAQEITSYREVAQLDGRNRRKMGESGQRTPNSELIDLRRGIGARYREMTSARIEAAVASSTPFLERLVHFWSNHFAVSAEKAPLVAMAGLFEFEAVRPNILGRFSDLLLAVEQHPAMLIYLDQVRSIGPGSQALAGGRRSLGLNENLAREILELHTLGVNGGYAQADVVELARALTGWTVAGLTPAPARRFLDGGRPGDFHFAERIHQPGERRILGRRYPQEGEAQARAVLMDLAVHPSTARHLATKLARHFAGDEPPPAMVERLARAYLSSSGDLPTLYRAIIDSPEAWAQQPVKFKSPWEWSVSALRAVAARDVERPIGTALLQQLGQPVWRPGSPAGWDDKGSSWTGPEALVRRVEAAERIASRTGTRTDARTLADKVLPGVLSPATRSAIAAAESPGQALALLLVAPEFVRR